MASILGCQAQYHTKEARQRQELFVYFLGFGVSLGGTQGITPVSVFQDHSLLAVWRTTWGHGD